MDRIMNELEKRIKELESIIVRAEKDVANGEDGFIRISRRDKKEIYHLQQNGKTSYIKKEDFDRVKRIAQKTYAQSVITKAKKELDSLRKMQAVYSPCKLDEVHTGFTDMRKALIAPYVLTDEEYRENWENQKGSSRENSFEIKGDIYTNKGEHVRSKSEKIIADELCRFGIPYKYEQCLMMEHGEILFPDFTVLNVKERKQFFWEHFGMMDDSSYVVTGIRKIESYERNSIWPGEKLIVTYETQEGGFNNRIVKSVIEKYLM
ncbi:MAG: hypothetical protein K5927_01635 [Lachnospiraceae bacterium]|nr:hypothetical protein [Lachnospiraceae bacterium]